ncbi:hypothetical protein [Roseibium sp. RKSG952]|uniref:hypothetical protein n=1 Tax=Roseibium sp. RKSG952 TaxID=2529384 RepID=UPI0012BCE0E7|nr:hypothetical protein [Roseibium sp. RKSG952]MTH98385.1 hypothetical protein [Roseibium sp. RKSG952]
MISTRIYAGGAIQFGGQPAIDDLLAAGYTAVIVWSVHVSTSGDLSLNDTPIVSDGIFNTQTSGDLPGHLAQLYKGGVQIIFSVGSGGVSDYANIGALLQKEGTGPTATLFRNFAALKQAKVDAGGDIDAIDFDNEEITGYPVDQTQVDTMTGFSTLLANVGFGSVTFCPYSSLPTWTETYGKVLATHGKGFVSAIHLQAYSGGMGNSPEPWGQMISDAGGQTLLIPGLATVQAGPGPWWNNGAIGESVVKTASVAQYGGGDWSNLLRVANFATADDALQGAEGGETFFFYCNGYLDLGPGKQFQKGDAVYFAGEPQWGAAPQCDGYALSGGCSNIYNMNGACPPDLQTQFQTWKAEKHPPDGGFIWLYDSVVNCFLSGSCGGSEQNPATTAKAYREAITNGLSVTAKSPTPAE